MRTVAVDESASHVSVTLHVIVQRVRVPGERGHHAARDCANDVVPRVCNVNGAFRVDGDAKWG